MSIYLNALVSGPSMAGKTALLNALGANALSKEVTVYEPNLESHLTFCFQESVDLPVSFDSLTCILLVYSLVNADSLRVIASDYLDKVCVSASPTYSFIILVGTHADLPSYRAVQTRDVTHILQSRTVSHFEVSNESVRGADSLLKMLRIRASYILRTHSSLPLTQERGRQTLQFKVVESEDSMQTKSHSSGEESVMFRNSNPLLMYIDIVLSPSDTRRIEVCRYDSALTLARKVLPGSDLELMLRLANVITQRVNDYCSTIRELTRGS
jgi:GTPase SAR1 family protein